MYTIAGKIFYTANDSKDVLIDAYLSTREHYYNRSAPKDMISELMSDVEGHMQLAEHIYNKSPDILAFAINQEAIYDVQLEYEKHWMDFLMTSLRFESRIIKTDTTCAYGALASIRGIDSRYETFLTSINGASYLSICRKSGIRSESGGTISLSDSFINMIKSIFLETVVNDTSIHIKYGPSMDISGILTLNRILHLFL